MFRVSIVAFRAVFGLLALTAVLSQAFFLVSREAFSPVNYLSYFTNLNNLIAATVLLIGAWHVLRRHQPTPTEDSIRGAMTLYMAATGLVYVTLLRHIDLGLLMPWVNTVLHYVLPLVVVVDWLLWPPRNKLALWQIGPWLILPFVYLVYSLIRGAATGWYPYPFLNPDKVGGYGGVLLYSVAILALFLVFGWAVVAIGNRLRKARSAT